MTKVEGAERGTSRCHWCSELEGKDDYVTVSPLLNNGRFDGYMIFCIICGRYTKVRLGDPGFAHIQAQLAQVYSMFPYPASHTQE